QRDSSEDPSEIGRGESGGLRLSIPWAFLDPLPFIGISSRHLSDRARSVGRALYAVSSVPVRQSRTSQVLPGMRGASGIDLREVSSRIAWIGEVLPRVWRADWAPDPGSVSRILYAEAPRRKDPDFSRRPRRRAQAGHGAVLRS